MGANGPVDAASERERGIDRIVLARQVNEAYRQALVNALITPLVACILAYVTRHAGPLSLRLGWLAVIFVCCLGLLLLSLHRRKHVATPENANRLKQHAWIFAALQGLTWGCGLFMLNPGLRDPELTFLVFAMVAGSSTELVGQGVLPWTYIIGALPLWVMVALATAQGPPPWPTLAPMVGLLTLLLVIYSRGLNRRLGQALRLAVVNEMMAAQLAAAHREVTTANAQLLAANEATRELAIRDELTGAYNRRHMLGVAGGELARSKRTGSRFTLLLIDLDHFKRVNDTFGHAVGDAVLRRFVKVAQSQVRSVDLLSRHGGEEFAVLAPDCDYEGAMALAERLRQAVASTSFVDLADGLATTISIGLSSYREGDTIDSLLERADAALYQAKSLGRNRVARLTAPAEHGTM